MACGPIEGVVSQAGEQGRSQRDSQGSRLSERNKGVSARISLLKLSRPASLCPWNFSDVCVLRKVGKALNEMSCSTSEKVAVIIVCEAMI